MIHHHMHTSMTSPVEQKFPGQIICRRMRLVKIMMLIMATIISLMYIIIKSQAEPQVSGAVGEEILVNKEDVLDIQVCTTIRLMASA